jgi:hypothetical protein
VMVDDSPTGILSKSSPFVHMNPMRNEVGIDGRIPKYRFGR